MGTFGIQSRKVEEVKKMECAMFSKITEEDKKVWQEWVDGGEKERRKSDLVDLLKQDVKDIFKYMALYTLLIPKKEYSFFYWENEVELQGVPGSFYLTFWPYLSLDLKEFAAHLICYFCKPELKVMKENGELHNYSYNECILTLLPFLSADSEYAQKLFECLDYRGYELEIKSNGCHCKANLQGIYCNETLDEKWKILFDRHIRKFLLKKFDEIQKKYSKENKDFQDKRYGLFNLYIHAASDSLKSHQSEKLAEEQIQFLMSIEAKHSVKYEFINDYCWSKIVNFLETKESLKNLLYDFIRFIVLENGKYFMVSFNLFFGDYELKRAKHLLDIYQGGDAKVVEKINNEIARYYQREKEHKGFDLQRAQEEELKKNTNSELYKKMK